MNGLDYLIYSLAEAPLIPLLIVIVWIIVLYFTKQLVSRLYYLEGFFRICAWCKKINYKDEWIPLDQFFAAEFDHKTTHGICPVCLKNVRLELNKKVWPTRAGNKRRKERSVVFWRQGLLCIGPSSSHSKKQLVSFWQEEYFQNLLEVISKKVWVKRKKSRLYFLIM